MLLKIPKKINNRYALDPKDHKEFSSKNIFGEPIFIGVRTPEIKNKYIKKKGYSYLFEKSRLSDGTYFYNIFLIYPFFERPKVIDIECNKKNLIFKDKYEKNLILKNNSENITYKNTIEEKISTLSNLAKNTYHEDTNEKEQKDNLKAMIEEIKELELLLEQEIIAILNM